MRSALPDILDSESSTFREENALLRLLVSYHRMARWVRHVLLVALTTFISGCGPWPPSDAALEKKFHSNRRVFDQLIMMTAEDSHLVRIAPDFTFLDTDFSWPRSNIGISNERWELYRQLFWQVGAGEGVNHPVGGHVTFFIAYTWGMMHGIDKGYAFSLDAVEPLLNSVDELPKGRGKQGQVFKPLEDHWYLYQGWE